MKKIAVLAALICLPLIGLSQKLKSIIKNNDTLKLEKFIEKGGELDILIPHKNWDKEEILLNPFSYAQIENSYAILDILIEHADSFKNKSHYLSEIFIHSLSRDEEELSQKLYTQGVNINDSCSLCHNNNAIMVAAAAGNEKWYFFLKDKSDLRYKNDDNVGLAHAAANSTSERIIKDILSIEGIDINAKDTEGYTPLDYSVWSEDSHENVFELLTEGGADFRKSGFMPLRYGYHPDPERGQFAIGLLEENGPRLFEYDQDSITILDFLCEIYDDEITEDQHLLLYNILDLMIDRLDSTNNTVNYTNSFLLEGNVSNSIPYISAVMGDDPADYLHLYRKYIEFIGATLKKGFQSPLTKKNFKYACKMIGEEPVLEWFAKFEVPIPE